MTDISLQWLLLIVKKWAIISYIMVRTILFNEMMMKSAYIYTISRIIDLSVRLSKICNSFGATLLTYVLRAYFALPLHIFYIKKER